MLGFLVTYVVPKFGELYTTVGAQLPALTQFMLAVGTGARKYILLCLLAMAGLIALLWQWKNSDKGADRIDRFVLALPLVGPIVLKYQVSNFSRILSTLLTG